MVKNYKKFVALLLSLCVLAGCTTTSDPTTETAPTHPLANDESVFEEPVTEAVHFENTAIDDAMVTNIQSTHTKVENDVKNMPALLIAGVPAVYDEIYGAYFFTVRDDNVWEDLTPSLEGYTLAYTAPLSDGSKESVVADNEPVTVMAYNDTQYMELPVLFTSLPVISMKTMTLPADKKYHDADEKYTVRYDSEGEPIPFDPYAAPPTDAENPIGIYDTFTEFMLLDAYAAENGYENGFTSLSRTHIRGRSSRNYPKNSFKIELLKEGENGVLEERDETLLGMRNDGDWNLNGMYAEPTKVRDKVAAEVWMAITADREYEGVSTGYDSAYVEVIINGRYHGAYLMTERIDKKQMGLQDGDRMYFSEGDVTTGRFAEFLNLDDNEDMTVGECSLEFPKERTDPYEEWVPFGELKVMYQATPADKFKESIDDMIDVDSLIDYEIFLQVASAVDNRIQNTFYIARLQDDGSYEFEFVPWDMDQTFGNRWFGDPPLLTGEDYWSVETTEQSFWVSSRMKSEDAADFNARLRERYAALCDEDLITSETIIKMINSSYKELTESGAWARNEDRWPEGGYVHNLGMIRAFVGNHMDYLDDLYEY